MFLEKANGGASSSGCQQPVPGYTELRGKVDVQLSWTGADGVHSLVQLRFRTGKVLAPRLHVGRAL